MPVDENRVRGRSALKHEESLWDEGGLGDLRDRRAEGAAAGLKPRSGQHISTAQQVAPAIERDDVDAQVVALQAVGAHQGLGG